MNASTSGIIGATCWITSISSVAIHRPPQPQHEERERGLALPASRARGSRPPPSVALLASVPVAEQRLELGPLEQRAEIGVDLDLAEVLVVVLRSRASPARTLGGDRRRRHTRTRPSDRCTGSRARPAARDPRSGPRRRTPSPRAPGCTRCSARAGRSCARRPRRGSAARARDRTARSRSRWFACDRLRTRAPTSRFDLVGQQRHEARHLRRRVREDRLAELAEQLVRDVAERHHHAPPPIDVALEPKIRSGSALAERDVDRLGEPRVRLLAQPHGDVDPDRRREAAAAARAARRLAGPRRRDRRRAAASRA